MKKIILSSLLLLLVLLLISAGRLLKSHASRFAKFEKRDVISCGYPLNEVLPDENGKFIPVMPGLGHHTYHISTKNDSAQIYFNQGLNYYYSYHLLESIASFKEAARFDPQCPMAYFGQALAMGPYFNSYYYNMNKEVPGVLKQMNALRKNSTEKEKALMAAILKRYSDDATNADRPMLDSNYAVALFAVLKNYPADNDIKALYIDAKMLQHKWDFWNSDGTPKPWTPRIIQYCEQILKADKIQPAAMHYYIHLTEASKQPRLALEAANNLRVSMPGVGHMVHMSTHMYQRNGLFPEGVAVNETATSIYNRIDSLAPSLAFGQNKIIHIFNVQSFCAISAGMYLKGMPIYDRARNRMLFLEHAMDKVPYSQGVFMTPVMAYVRLGKWEKILDDPLPDASWKYAVALSDFARGMAYVRMNQLSKAKVCLAHLETTLRDSLLQIRQMPFNKPVTSCNIARGILKGEIFSKENRNAEAVTAFKNAISEEDQLIYREPPDWVIPARQFLGEQLLKMKKPVEAEKVYKEDLFLTPGNGWSEVGMYNSLTAQGRIAEAKVYKARYMNSFREADVKVTRSVF